MCNVRCCGAFWSTLILVAIITALAAPMYIIAAIQDHDSTVAPDCAVGLVYTWKNRQCGVSDKCPPLVGCAFGMQNGDSQSWRDTCGANKNGPCSTMGSTADATVAFLVFSMLLTIAFTVMFYLRCCGRMSGKSRMHGGLGVAATIMLFIAVVTFGGNWAKAVNSDMPEAIYSMCTALDDGGSTPCNTLVGGRTKTDNGNKMHAGWLPGGWWAALVGLIIYVFTICCAFSRSGDEAMLEGTYATLVPQQGGYMPPGQPQYAQQAYPAQAVYGQPYAPPQQPYGQAPVAYGSQPQPQGSTSAYPQITQ